MRFGDHPDATAQSRHASHEALGFALKSHPR
jgi:hypothetical protein